MSNDEQPPAEISVVLANFMNENKRELVQIYIQERQQQGDGVLMIMRTREDKVDCVYKPIRELDPILVVEVLKKMEAHPSQSLIYFYLCENNAAVLIELDLDDMKA